MPRRAVPEAAVAKSLLSAREVISLPQPKPSSFERPGGTASGSQQRGEQQPKADRDHGEPLCAFCLVLTKHSTSIKKPRNRPVWHGKTSPPSQEMLCFPSIRFIYICSVLQTMSSTFSALVWNLPWQTHLSKHKSAELGWSLMPHYPCPTREFALGETHANSCQGVCTGAERSVPASSAQPLPSLCWAGIANL